MRLKASIRSVPRMLRGVRGIHWILCFGMGVLAQPVLAQTREIKVTGVAAQCLACRIDLNHVATIGSVHDEHLYSQHSQLVRARQAYYVANSFTPGVILVYSPEGRFSKTIGRFGRGPGEIARESLIHVTPEDSLLVASNGRITIFSSVDSRAVRSWNYDWGVWGLTSLKGGVTAAALAPNLSHETVRIFDPDGSQRASVLYDGLLQHRDQLAQRVYSAGDTLLLVSATGAYQLRAFDSCGRLRWTLHRDVEWFMPYARQPRNAGIATPTLPDIVGAWIEADRYLWVLLERSAENWRPVEQRPRLDAMDFNSLFDSQLEIIDLQTGRLLASQRVNWLRPAAPSQPFLYTARYTPSGEVVFDVWRATLSQLPQGGAQ